MPTLPETQFNQMYSYCPCKHIAPPVYFTFTFSLIYWVHFTQVDDEFYFHASCLPISYKVYAVYGPDEGCTHSLFY